jgi:hypothetical protein
MNRMRGLSFPAPVIKNIVTAWSPSLFGKILKYRCSILNAVLLVLHAEPIAIIIIL